MVNITHLGKRVNCPVNQYTRTPYVKGSSEKWERRWQGGPEGQAAKERYRPRRTLSSLFWFLWIMSIKSSFIWYDFKWTANKIKEGYDKNSSLVTSEYIELNYNSEGHIQKQHGIKHGPLLCACPISPNSWARLPWDTAYDRRNTKDCYQNPIGSHLLDHTCFSKEVENLVYKSKSL